MGKFAKALVGAVLLLIVFVALVRVVLRERPRAQKEPMESVERVAVETPTSNAPIESSTMVMQEREEQEDPLRPFSSRFKAGIQLSVKVAFNQASDRFYFTAAEKQEVEQAVMRAVRRLHVVQAGLSPLVSWDPVSGQAEIVVPGFEQAGAQIRADLVNELEAVLGDRAEGFGGDMGLLHNNLFQDFGAYDQAFHIRSVPGESDMLIVAREVIMHVEAKSGPGSTGQTWQTGKSAESLVPLDALIDGEFQFLNEPFQQVSGQILQQVSGP